MGPPEHEGQQEVPEQFRYLEQRYTRTHRHIRLWFVGKHSRMKGRLHERISGKCGKSFEEPPIVSRYYFREILYYFPLFRPFNTPWSIAINT